ncbi:hypothetical protein EDB83DRAFT_2412293 [Lactarius deliciosus]|nr:hypothetical protein EDB83DRAFT_2412293 [Lactarius deliciosus]
MNRHPKVKTALICICEDSEAAWVKRHFPGRAFLVTNSADIPKVLRGFLSSMVDRIAVYPPTKESSSAILER